MYTIFLLLLLQGAGARAKIPAPITPPKPTLTVSFDRSSIRQQDCVNVELLVTNESELELTYPSLGIYGPALFTWYPGFCEKTEKGSALRFGEKPNVPSLDFLPISAWSTRKQQLHFRTGDTVEVGEFNCLFTFQYYWRANQESAESFVSAEKPIKVSFLGNESVAGIPLALAGFIVPGLLFWLFVKAFGARWAASGLSDQMVYSVMVSVGIIALGAWLRRWDVSSGVSIGRLITLGVTGAVLGFIAGVVDLGVRKFIAYLNGEKAKQALRQRFAQQIDERDTEASLLGKLLALPAEGRLEQPIFVLKNGQSYLGALGARTRAIDEDGGNERTVCSLVGSFAIDFTHAQGDVLIKMTALRDERKLRELVQLANANNLLSFVNEIKEVKNDNLEEGQIGIHRVWSEDQIESHSTNNSGWNTDVLAYK
jgi:hypothetical protein